VLGVYGINCEVIDILVTKTHATVKTVSATPHSVGFIWDKLRNDRYPCYKNTRYSYTEYLEQRILLGVYGINCEVIDILVTKTHVTVKTVSITPHSVGFI
jgi:hypothetical protein